MSEFIYTVQLERSKLIEEVLKLTSDAEWTAFETKHFNFREYTYLDNDTFGKNLDRAPIPLGDCLWKPTAEAYSVDALILLLHQELYEIYSKNTHPDSWAEYINQENMARYCMICRRYAKGFDKDNCPFCGHYLTHLYLNYGGENQTEDLI